MDFVTMLKYVNMMATNLTLQNINKNLWAQCASRICR